MSVCLQQENDSAETGNVNCMWICMGIFDAVNTLFKSENSEGGNYKLQKPF